MSSRLFFTLWLLCVSVMPTFAIKIPQGFEATFEQRITTPKNKQLYYKGIVRFAKDSEKLYWRYDLPNHQEVCSDQKQLIVVDHDLEQVSYFALKKGLSLHTILQNAKAYPKKPNLYTAQADGTTYTIKIDDTKKLHSVAFYDDLDNKVQIIFSKVRYLPNPPPLQSLTCKIPSRYDQIR